MPLQVEYFIQRFTHFLSCIIEDFFSEAVFAGRIVIKMGKRIDGVQDFLSFGHSLSLLVVAQHKIVDVELKGNFGVILGIRVKNGVENGFCINIINPGLAHNHHFLVGNLSGLIVHNSDFPVGETVQPVDKTHKLVPGIDERQKTFYAEHVEMARFAGFQKFEVVFQSLYDILLYHLCKHQILSPHLVRTQLRADESSDLLPQFRGKGCREPVSYVGFVHPAHRCLDVPVLAVDPAHHIVEDVSEGAAVQIVHRLLDIFQPLYLAVVELCRATQILLQKGCGEIHIPAYDVQVLLSLDYRWFITVLPCREFGHAIGDVRIVEIVQLLDIAAFLPCLDSIRAGIIEQPHILRTLDEPVEIIGPDCILILIGRQAETLAQLRRNEGGIEGFAWEHTLVAGEDYQIPEIQSPGLQWAHHLQAFERLSRKRHGDRLQKLFQEFEPGDRLDIEFHIVQTDHSIVAGLREYCFHTGVPGLGEQFPGTVYYFLKIGCKFPNRLNRCDKRIAGRRTEPQFQKPGL